VHKHRRRVILWSLFVVSLLSGVVLPVLSWVRSGAVDDHLRATGTSVRINVEYVDQPQGRGWSPARLLVGYQAGADWENVWTGCELNCPRENEDLNGWFDPSTPAHFVTDSGLSSQLVPSPTWYLVLPVGLLSVMISGVALIRTR
jgi:hypothetical protein